MKKATRKSASAKRGRSRTKKMKQQQPTTMDSLEPQITANKGW